MTNKQELVKYAKICNIASNVNNNTYKRICVEESSMIIVKEKDDKINRLIISFAGSNEKRDWELNFKFYRRKFISNDIYCGRVHSGFLEYYNNLKDKMFEEINIFREEEGEKEIVFCGHSLGGSCSIGALDVFLSFYKIPIKLYTYGAPKIGNKYFSSLVNKNLDNSYRIVKNNDFITNLPPLFWFSHNEKLIYTTASKKHSGFLKSVFLFILEKMRCKNKDMTAEHGIDKYVRDLNKLDYIH